MHSIQAYQTSILDLQNRLLSRQPEGSDHSAERTTDVNLSTKKNIDISIMTAEGDRVTLSAKSEASGTYATYNSTGLLSSLQNSSLSLSTSREISLLIEGDLSEEEMEDIEALLNKIDSIAKKFFKGDVDEAIEKALNIGDFDTIESLEAHLQFETNTSVSVQHSGITETPVDQSASEESDHPDVPETTHPSHSYLTSSESKGSLNIAQNGTSKDVSAQTEFEETTTTKENGVIVDLAELARSYEFTSSLIIEPPEPQEGLIAQVDSEESSIAEEDSEENSKVNSPVPQDPEEVTLLNPVNTSEVSATTVAQEESENAESTVITPTQTLPYERTVNVTIQASVTTTGQTQSAEEPITMATLKEAFESMTRELDEFGRRGRRHGRSLGRRMNHHFDQMSRSHNRHGAKMQLFQMIKKALMEKIQGMVQFDLSIQISTGSTQQTDSSQTDSTQETDNSGTGSTQQDDTPQTGTSGSTQDESTTPQLSDAEIASIESTTALYEGYSTAQYRSHVTTLSEAGNEDTTVDATQPEEETVEAVA